MIPMCISIPPPPHTHTHTHAHFVLRHIFFFSRNFHNPHLSDPPEGNVNNATLFDVNKYIYVHTAKLATRVWAWHLWAGHLIKTTLHHNQSTALSKHAQEQTHQATQSHSQGNVEGEGNTHIYTTTTRQQMWHASPMAEMIQFPMIYTHPQRRKFAKGVSLFSFIPFPWIIQISVSFYSFLSLE